MFFGYSQPAESTGQGDVVPGSPSAGTTEVDQHPRPPQTVMPGGLPQTQSSVDNNAVDSSHIELNQHGQTKFPEGPWTPADGHADTIPSSPPSAPKGVIIVSPRSYDGTIHGEEGNGQFDALNPNRGPVQADSIVLVEAKTDAEIAQDTLTAKEKNRLSKSEAKTNKKLTEALKTESKISKMTLSSAMKQLSEAQANQKTAVSQERKTHAAHAKAVSACTKAEAAYLEAKTRWEKGKVEVASKEEALEAAKRRAVEANERVGAAMSLAERLRQGNLVDERERGIKQAELSGRTVSGRRSLYFGSFGGRAF